MCRRATCKICGKTTWAGCGKHADRVMAGVPRDDRCLGHESMPNDARRSPASRSSGNWFSRIIGR